MSLPAERAEGPNEQEQGEDFSDGELLDALREEVLNGKPVEWFGFVGFTNLTPLQAAILAHRMNPIRWPDGTHCKQGEMPPHIRESIAHFEQWLRGRRVEWSLRELVEVLGQKAPEGMRNAVEATRPPEELKERRNAAGFYTLEEASQALGAQQGMHDGARQSLEERMMEAARDGSLTVRDPHTDLPFRPAVVRSFWERVTPADVNAWLERCGVPYRWNAPTVEPEGAATQTREVNGDNGLPTATVHRLEGGRSDFLREAIQRAIQTAGTRDTAAVFMALRQMALNVEDPFTGLVDNKGLHYTDHNNKVQPFTRDALRKRLNPDARGKKSAR